MNSEPAAVDISANIPSTAGMTTKVVKGSIWTLVGQVLPLGASLIATPFVIRLLGAEQYGVLALMNVLLGYLGFADFGMGMASTNFASEAYANGSEEKEAKAVWLAALIALCTTTVTAIVVVVLARFIVIDLLNIPPHLQDVATVAVYLSCVTFAARVLAGIFNSPQLVRLRMDLNSSINGLFNVAQIVAVPIVIYLGGGIVGAVITVMVAAVGTLLIHIAVSGRLLKALFTIRIDRSAVKPLVRFGFTIFIALIASVVLANLEKVVLTRYTSVTVFAYYSVAFTLANMVTLFSASMAQSLIPAFSQLYSRNELPELQALYTRTIKLNLVVFAPAAMVLCLIAKPFFTIWAGEEFGKESTYPFYILVVGLFFSFSGSVAGSMMVAARKTKASAILYWVELFPYLLLVAAFTYRWGAVGAALAWSCRLFFDTAALSFLVKRMVGLSFSFFQKEMLLLLFAILFLILGAATTTVITNQYWLPAVAISAALVCYAGLVWMMVVTVDERIFMTSVFRKFSSRYITF